MNERIRQLAEQAMHYAASRPVPELKDRDLYLDNLFEKFAQLIVRECALTAGLMEHADRKNIGAGILDRFGVSE
jgi:hypothetical protein